MPRRSPTAGGLSFKQVLEGRKVGIFHGKHPEGNLDADQLRAVQEAVINKILVVKEDSVKSKFLGTIYKAGYLMITCADETTEE